MGDSPKGVKSRRQRKKEREKERKLVITMTKLRMAHKSRLDQFPVGGNNFLLEKNNFLSKEIFSFKKNNFLSKEMSSCQKEYYPVKDNIRFNK